MLSGIITPLITPLKLDQLSLDITSLNKVIEHVIAGGVHGIFILGTTGEAPNISYTTRRHLIIETVKITNNRVPVVVGISDTSLEESLQLASISKEAGAIAVVAAPPYYYGLSTVELFNYFWQLADKLPLPLYLYNMPSHTKTNIDVETVMQLAEHPNIVGLKDSSANTVYFQKLCHMFKNSNFDLFVGPEEITPEMVVMGASGGVNGGSNLFPKLYTSLYQAALAKDFDRIYELTNLVMEISTKIYNLGSFGSSYLKGMKGAASILGLTNNTIAPPFNNFEEKEMNKLRKALEAIVPKVTKIA